MIKWGVSALFHDASIVVVSNNKILFASSAERFSRVKSDKHLNPNLIKEALKFGYPDEVYWYENTLLKSLRIFLKNKKIKFYFIKKYLKAFGINTKILYTQHHLSHLRSSIYSAPFEASNSLGLVVDAVGEFDSLSIWNVQNSNYKKIYAQKYPRSLGLFYSALTDYIGLHPLDEEYILMGMSAYGDNSAINTLLPLLKKDLSYGCKKYIDTNNSKFNIASSTQKIFEDELLKLVKTYLNKTNYKKILYSGGCALNCKANAYLSSLASMWIFPNPGDSGSSLGAIDIDNLNFNDMFLGLDVGVNLKTPDIINILAKGYPVGVLNGRAEFGPRALGNRSILADPRNRNMKNIVNKIKGREMFRPFAPCVLEEFANEYFDLNPNVNYSYMQYTSVCKVPELIPSVVHKDNTSRVQVVTKDNIFLYRVLKEWYSKTKCPVLLNTSLNIKGKPIVNSYNDLHEFKNGLTII